ncbi:Membrane protein [uncultured Thiomicrorhabdus sp.]
MEQNVPLTKPETPQTPISTTVPTIIYILFLANIVMQFTGLIGLIMAYVNKGDDNYLESHYQFQIRTFWIGLLFGLLGLFTLAIAIGWLILFVVLVWWVIRCAVGLKYLGKRQPVPNPTSWGTGS